MEDINNMEMLDKFINRLHKIGIDVLTYGNFPWIYIGKINGKPVIERFRSEHGFTLCYLPIKINVPITEFTDTSEIFKLIRKYVGINYYKYHYKYIIKKYWNKITNLINI